jgi:hypothetical protein
VAEVAALWPALPLVANLRCGLWYAPPRAFVATCYFKSTDGHARNWSFSTARLNLHLALLAGTLLLSSSSGQISSHHLILDHVSSLWDVNMIPRCR